MAVRVLERPVTDPQLLHHRPHRPRQVDACRPVAGANRHSRDARHAGPAARHARPRARARHHHQGTGGAPRLHGARRAHLPAQPHRHAGARRLRLRGVALAGRVRGRRPRRRCLTGDRGADARQRLRSAGGGPRDHPRDQQDRPARRRPGAGPPGDRGRHRPARRRRHPRQRPPGNRHRRDPRGGGRSRAGSHRRRWRAAAGAHLRQQVRRLPRRHRLRACDAWRHPPGSAHPHDGDRQGLRRRRDRCVPSPEDVHRVPQPRRGGLRGRVGQGRPRQQGRRHGDGRVQPGAATSARLSNRDTDGVRRDLPHRQRQRPGAQGGSRQAQPQRRLAGVRAGVVGGAGVRLPLRVPRAAAHGDRPGAPGARVRPRAAHHGADRRVPRAPAQRRDRGHRQPGHAPRPGHGRRDRGAAHAGDDLRPQGLRRAADGALPGPARRAPRHAVPARRPRRPHLRPPARARSSTTSTTS